MVIDPKVEPNFTAKRILWGRFGNAGQVRYINMPHMLIFTHWVNAGLHSTGIRAGSSHVSGDIDLGVEERVSGQLTPRAYNTTNRACSLQISIILSRWSREVRLLRPDRVHPTYCAYQGTLGPDRRQDHMRRRSGCGQEICGTDHRQRCCPWGCPHERVSVALSLRAAPVLTRFIGAQGDLWTGSRCHTCE